MSELHCQKRLKVAIIGGGPAGLGAAIELSRLSFVDWELYERKPQINETGGGLSLQAQTWKLLETNGAAKHIQPDDYFRCEEGQIEQRRYVCAHFQTIFGNSDGFTGFLQERQKRRIVT